MDERSFGERIHAVLFPSTPIESHEFLFGRDEQLDRIRRALMAPARQIFIYGERGVGKSSLGNAAAAECQSSDAPPLRASCSSESTFLSVVNDLLRATHTEALGAKTERTEVKVGVKLFALGSHADVTTPAAQPPLGVDEAAERLGVAFAGYSSKTVAVIDEFDRIPLVERGRFAELLKALGDKRSNVKLIFTGVASSLDELLVSHGSAHRQLDTIELTRLVYNPRLEIVNKALRAFDLDADPSVIYRIADVSNGFPYYVHLLAEHLLWAWYENKQDQITMDHLHKAFATATSAVHADLKRPYEQATLGREHVAYVLWAAADAFDLERTSDAIFRSYEQICDTLDVQVLPRDKFRNVLRQLRDVSHGAILDSPGRRLHRFREAMVRGYVRLAAACKNIHLDDENFDLPPQMTVRTARMSNRKRWMDTSRFIPPVEMGR